MKKYKFTYASLVLSLFAVPFITKAYYFPHNLKIGSKGPDVVALQNILIQDGYLISIADGVFGNKTLTAVQKLQTANRFSSIPGTVGPKTRALLNKSTPQPQSQNQQTTTRESQSQNQTPQQNASANVNQYNLAQAMSDGAQLSTISFDGLAFITGSSGADTFFPPGKVADYFGFQYMRDVDVAGYGHNTTFLPKVADNVLSILTDAQKAQLIALAKVQAPRYVNFAYNRFLLSNAFRRNLEGKIPTGSTGLNTSAVETYTGDLYQIDAELAYNRALVVGSIINSFNDTQKAYLAKMKFNDSSTWSDVEEDQTLKKGLTNDQYTAVMTYASELFSWYKGGLDADVYFCPERHGTYFGGFFMKDYLAVGNNDYFISTAETGDSGKGFLDTLNPTQKALITGIIDEQRSAIQRIAQLRTTISTELNKTMTGGTPNKDLVYSSIQQYGQLDGQLSALYATRFAQVKATLTDAQMVILVKLRNLSVVPTGAYLFSNPVAMPIIPSTDFLFGVGSVPVNEGQTTPPTGFDVATTPPANSN